MANTTSSTPFPLGAYLGNPDNSSAANEALFEGYYSSFTALMGATPQFFDTYVDQNQSISDWVGNSDWAASSSADSVDAKTMTPVIALPMSSNAPGSLAADQSYQAFASGQYDSVIQGIVQAWASQGFTNLVFRPGWEMNLEGPNYAGADAQSQADWVAAFKHVYTVLHQAAVADGVTVQVVWNPGATNYSNAEATTNLYPGNSYVDIIGADAYSDIYPFSDGGTTATYHDWDTGKEDTSVAQFIADPVNREHYWSEPAATEWASDSSGGHSQSLDSLIQFAEEQGKPFAVPETGAGNSSAGTDVSDDGAYPEWLAQQLTAAEAAGEKIDFVNLWDSNGGGNYEFSEASDNKPAEAAAWAKYFGASPTGPVIVDPPPASTPATITVGSGADTLALSVAEDAWQGDAQFTISVDGQQIGGTQTTTASHAAGQLQTFDVRGSFGTGSHVVSVNFLNDAYGGSAATDRNLYVTGASIDGKAVPNGSLTLMSSGAQSFSFTGPTVASAPPSPVVTVGSGSDTLALSVSEDAWNGDAQFTISIDGQQVGGTQTATASHAAGGTQTFDVKGNFSAGQHAVSVNFLNDAYGGSAATDRNLYVTGASIDGKAVANSTLALMAAGSQSLAFTEAAATAPTTPVTPSDTLDVKVAEDAWGGDANYTISVDGAQIGGVRTATASHAAGATQDVSLSGNWGSGAHTIGISFINDAYGGTTATDRNLYVQQVTYDGQSASGAPAALMSNGTANFTTPGSATALTFHLAEDAWNGDAQYSIAVDGKTLVQDGTATASNALGQSQALNLQDALSAGGHDVTVSFLNDAYGGTAATDRNLYVKGIDVNGTAIAGGTAALMSTGTDHFQIVVPAH